MRKILLTVVLMLGGCVFDSMGLGPGDPSAHMDFSLESGNYDGPRPDKPPDILGSDQAVPDAKSVDGAMPDQKVKPDLPVWDGPRPDKPTDLLKSDLAVADAKLVDGPVKPDLPVVKPLDQSVSDLMIAPDLPKVCTHPKVVQSCANGWCKIPAGCFKMGSPSSELCREPSGFGKETQHQVTLTRSFEIGQTEVTQAQFKTLMGGWNPSVYVKVPASDPHPVEGVSWHAAAAYCNALSKSKGLKNCYTCIGSTGKTICGQVTTYSGNKIYNCPGYRLPTGAEWEYTYRGGITTATYVGNLTDCTSNSLLTGTAWYGSYTFTKKANSKTPNKWSVIGMAGNVAEWTNDWHKVSLGSSWQTDPVGSPTGTTRVVRNGHYKSMASELRAAVRSGKIPTSSSATIGFRCVRTLP
jgi:formylglycine-generating enzyme required for sulfatase activity